MSTAHALCCYHCGFVVSQGYGEKAQGCLKPNMVIMVGDKTG